MNTNSQIPKQILDHLRDVSKSSESEVCGLIFNNERFRQCKNLHPDSKNYFLISPKEYLECLLDYYDENVILFHSHPEHIDLVGFSDWDLENQYYSQLKMLLYSVKHDEFYFKDL